MASWHLAELQHFSPITKHSFSGCWTFFLDREHFSVAFDVAASRLGMVVNPQLNDFSSGEALFWSPGVFCQILEKQHFWPFPSGECCFSCLWKYIILVHTYIYTFTENNFHAIKNLHKISSLIAKHCVNSIERVFRINLQITLHVKPSACNWNGRRNSQRIEPSTISGNLCQRRSEGEGWSKGGN